MFRPCIDLHEGKVKQIVGGTLAPDPTNCERILSRTAQPVLRRTVQADGLKGGHIFMLVRATRTGAAALALIRAVCRSAAA